MVNYINNVQRMINGKMNPKSGDYKLYELGLLTLVKTYKNDTKHFFYIPKVLSDIFPYELVSEIYVPQQNKYLNYLVKNFRKTFSHLFLYYYILKKTLSIFKKLSIFYYKCNNLTERLKLRYIVQETINTQRYNDKYNFSGKKKEKGFIDLIIKNINLLTYYHDIEIGGIISRAIKSHIFGINEIIKVINALTKLPVSLHNGRYDKNLILLLLSYNDALIFEHLNNKEFQHRLLHEKNNNIIEKLLKCNLGFMKTLGEKYASKLTRHVNMGFLKKISRSMEVLKIVSMSDNSFSQELTHFEKEGFQNLSHFIKLFKKIIMQIPKKHLTINLQI
jgi:hypothetical protein